MPEKINAENGHGCLRSAGRIGFRLRAARCQQLAVREVVGQFSDLAAIRDQHDRDRLVRFIFRGDREDDPVPRRLRFVDEVEQGELRA